MKVLAIIPARGGSKGIPGKNIRPVNGKPLIAWTIENAINAISVDRVIVSTDSKKIAAVAEIYRTGVVTRPPDISGDLASAESVLIHALDHLERTEQYSPDILVFLQCTSPTTTPEDIDNTVWAMSDQNADSALSVVPFHYFLWDAHANALNHDRATRPRRQDREPQFVETGGVYVMRTKGFLEAKHRFFGKTVIYNCGNRAHLEIDEPDDLVMADALLREAGNGKD